MGCKRSFLKERKNVLFLNKILEKPFTSHTSHNKAPKQESRPRSCNELEQEVLCPISELYTMLSRKLFWRGPISKSKLLNGTETSFGCALISNNCHLFCIKEKIVGRDKKYREGGREGEGGKTGIKFYWCAEQNLFTAWIHWQTAAAVCPTWFFLLLLKLWWLILLASCQYLLCSWNILRFPGLIIVSNLHYIGVSSYLIYSDNFLSLYGSNSFQFWIKLFFNLHTSAHFTAL